MKFSRDIVDRGVNAVYNLFVASVCLLVVYYTTGYLYSIDSWFSFPISALIIIIFYELKPWVLSIGR